MTSCTLPNNGGTTTFTYGADGLRRSKTTNGITTNFVYDNSMLVEEMQYNASAGALQASTTYFEGPNGPAYSLSGEAGSIPEWYIANGLGSVVGQIDANGNLQASGEYDIYGNARGVQSGTFTSNHRFVGQLGHTTDAETGGLIYMRARYCDPATGRFVSEDPKHDGSNWFAYCACNPTNAVDLSGCAGLADLLALLLIIAFIVILAWHPWYHAVHTGIPAIHKNLHHDPSSFDNQMKDLDPQDYQQMKEMDPARATSQLIDSGIYLIGGLAIGEAVYLLALMLTAVPSDPALL